MIRRAPRLGPAAVLLCGVLYAGCGSGNGEQQPGPLEANAVPAAAVEEGEAEAAAEPATPLSRLRVTLYFPSRSADGLRSESRDIFQTTSPVERAKQILSDLIAGPSGPEAYPALPPGTRLRQVFVLESGLAYADFSSELRDGISGGTADELYAIYSIVNSLALNIPEITRVAILVDGQPCQTLSGHLDLRRPLTPEPSLAVADEPEVLL